MCHELLDKTNDYVFKTLFGSEKSKEYLADFLKNILDIPEEEYEDIVFLDTHTRPGTPLENEYIMDLVLKTKSGKMIDIEMQVQRSPVMKQRIIVYLSNMVKEQSGTGKKYNELQKSVSIIIAAKHRIVKTDKEYFHRFNMSDLKTKTQFTDLLEIVTLELTKLPKNDDGTELYDWLKFIKTDNEGEMKMLAEENEKIEIAYNNLKKLSEDQAVRLAAVKREGELQDQMAREDESYTKGKQNEKIEIAKNSLVRGLDIETISAITGLTPEEIEKLK